jgi:hypothetical protein
MRHQRDSDLQVAQRLVVAKIDHEGRIERQVELGFRRGLGVLGRGLGVHRLVCEAATAQCQQNHGQADDHRQAAFLLGRDRCLNQFFVGLSHGKPRSAVSGKGPVQPGDAHQMQTVCHRRKAHGSGDFARAGERRGVFLTPDVRLT